MYLVKSVIITFCLLFFGLYSFAQTTFDSVGRVTTIARTNDSILSPASPLWEEGQKVKEEIRLLFLDKTEEAIRIIKSNNYRKSQHKFFMQVWSGDSTSLLNYLNAIRTSLESGTIMNAPGLAGSLFQNNFNKHLSDTAAVFRWVALDSLEGVLVKKDVFKSFITDYYNETLPGIRGKYINKEDIVESTYFLLEQPGKIKSLIKSYRSSLGKFNKPLYDSLINYHQSLIIATSPYSKSIVLLKEKWFKDWFWISGGMIRINPIHFGIDTITKKYVSDLSKAETVDRSNNEVYIEERLDTLDRYFMQSKSEIDTTGKWVNKVSIPKDNTYFQFSAIDPVKFVNDEKEMKRNLRVDEHKVIVIHNIPGQRKAGLREDRKPIPNRSAFEEGLDDVISNLGALAKAYGQVSSAPWSLAANFLAPPPNYNRATIRPTIIPGVLGLDGGTDSRVTITINSSDTFSVSGLSGDDFLLDIKNYLRSKNLFIAPIFNSIFGTSTVTFGMAAINPYKNEFQIKFHKYLELISQEAANQLLEDSFMVAGLIRVYNQASTPLLQPIRTKQDIRLSYYSSTQTTTSVDSTLEITVSPYTVIAKNNSDTIFFSKFKYKVGRAKRFTLGAGIAYTLNSYDQSVAKSENGAITVTNNNQLFRFVVGLNFYFIGEGLYSLDNSLGKINERWYVFFGVGLPKALENLYIGVGRDLWTGLKLTAGVHIAKHNKYLIQNNQIVEERLRYSLAGPFISVAIDPASLVNLLNVFKK